MNDSCSLRIKPGVLALELSTWQNCAVGNLVHVSHFNPEASGKAQQKVECGEWGGGERGSNVSIGKG